MLPLIIGAGVGLVALGGATYTLFHQDKTPLKQEPKRAPNPEEPDEQYGWEVSKNNRIPILPKNSKISGEIDSSYVTLTRDKEKRHEVRTEFQDPNTQRKTRYRYSTNSKGEQTGNTLREEYNPEDKSWTLKEITPYKKRKPTKPTTTAKKAIPPKPKNLNPVVKGQTYITK